jgi:predicted nucleic acid-binding protein
MPVDCFFDSSVLIYILTRDDPRWFQATRLLNLGGFISVQVLNEFTSVARRKLRLDWDVLELALKEVREFCEEPLAVTVASHEAGLEIAQRYKYHIYDSLIIAAALDAGCTTLYSEDMQDGQRIGALTIRNPFRVN